MDIILLSTADWDNPFWTNKQHVALELSRLGHRVLYVDSLGLRRPTASARDLRRIGKRLMKAVRPPRKVRDNLWVWSPVVLPWQRYSVIRRINRLLLNAGLWLWMKALGLKRQWLWTYNPLTTAFFDLRSFDCCIYHCVDEIKAQPGMPVEALEQAEEDLSRRVAIIFATSTQLAETRRVWNAHTYYLPNVADFQHFNTALDPRTVIPADLAAIPGPRMGFIGAISGYKVDLKLIRHLAESRPDWSIILIGEVGEGDPWTDASLLHGLDNLHLLGPRAYEDLPAYLKGFDAALLPNLVNDYTDAMFPMKFFEYLAAGCPVVSVKLKALEEFTAVASVTSNPAEFTAAIEQVLGGNAPDLEQRLSMARAHTYEARTLRMLALIDGVCS
ncbi:glycosyltransferase [Alcaligenaceae bacterium]|nr:glycosyltransferase [Alcaligenaceae bacterium]